MQLSIIISTYNSPAWLEKVLWGYSCQTHQDFELIIADDGSDHRTAELLERMRGETGLNIRHIWQEDKGFRKSRILNKAILQAQHDYLVFTDGDCIPRRDFLQVHAEEARPGHYLSGGYFKLPMSTSKTISKDDIISGRCFDVSWLRRHGLGFWRKNYKIALGPKAARIFNRITTTPCNLKGSNASVWKADALNVNGLDERMPWGGQDREFGVRLINSGVKPKHVRFNAIVIHLDHARGYADPARVKANRELRIANEKNKVITTEHGIRQLGDED